MLKVMEKIEKLRKKMIQKQIRLSHPARIRASRLQQLEMIEVEMMNE